jgi:hypothetical protein
MPIETHNAKKKIFMKIRNEKEKEKRNPQSIV